MPAARNGRVLVLVAAMIGTMTGLVIYAPTLYRTFCSLTGVGGTVQRAVAPVPAGSTAGNRTVTVRFDANVAPDMPWAFRPAQREVEARLGEPVQAYYLAHNLSDAPVVGHATFNVTPYKAAPYFFKIECFCFTDERLGPGESARMPLTFYVDEQLASDPATGEIRDITLSYTFFRQSGLSPAELAGARDLKAGSEAIDERLAHAKPVEFENDAPRH